jgi:crotonobetainyl-CoA:carnitine CoA-transferase CaiB-like acyl-CoA transferase
MSAKPSMLQGIRVVDLTSVVFGPYATKMIADLGADVIKVEPPIGDNFRYAGRPAKSPGMGHGHMALNVGKRSVALDLKSPEDLEAMRRLLAEADVFIHNVRGKAIERLGLGYAAVKALKPDIVYVHCVGFGQDGPYADLQAYDDVIQAASGTASLASRVDGNPAPRYLPSLVADKVAGLHGAYAVLGALIHRLRTGEGQYVEVPMFEAFAHFMLLEHMGGATFDPPTGSWGYPRQLDPARQPFPTADGWISIVPYTAASVRTTFEVLGCPELAEDPRFSRAVKNMAGMSEVFAEIARRTPARTTEDWCARFRAADIPAMPVRDLEQMLDEPHLAATGFFRRRVHSSEGAWFDMVPPVRFSVMPEIERREPPRVGQHTEELKGGG